MSKLIERIEFDYMWEGDKEEERVNMAQLKFPYFSPEDNSPKVLFKNDAELNHKMRKVRKLNKTDIVNLGIGILSKYDEDQLVQVIGDMLRDFEESSEEDL